MGQSFADSYDFIIVGGGTAGNVVAGRLAENPNVKVLVVEAGVENPNDVSEITTPARAFELRNSQYDWAYQTTFVDKPDYERVEKPNTRGKVLGGRSSLNYYNWIPGSKPTFDAWAEYGGDKWTWDQCQKYLEKPASYHDDGHRYDPKLSRLGREGPLHISHASLLPQLRPFCDALTKAWTSMGHLLQDVFSGQMNGLAHCMNTIYNGVRSNSSVFMKGKSNVDVMASTVARKVNFDEGTATSITVLRHEKSEITIRAKREIIIACGVFETPKLLLLSGVGPRVELARHGIEPVVISEHVGENPLDHPILPHIFCLIDGLGLDNYLLWPGQAHSDVLQQYLDNKTSPLSSGLLELVALPQINERLEKYEVYREA